MNYNHMKVTKCTVNSKFFARILFSRKVLKDIFATIKNRNEGMINLYE